jgi:hypothetical protein
MMVVHESGHVVGAWLTGGKVERIVAHPLTFSRTDLSQNPRPLLVAWAGPVGGCLFPFGAFGLAFLCRMPGLYLLQFFAAFCLIANGAYIGVGSFLGAGDAGDLLRHGAATWQLWAFGLAAAPLGLYLWHNQGSHFGLGKAKGKVQPVAAYVVLAILLTLVAVELLFGAE